MRTEEVAFVEAGREDLGIVRELFLEYAESLGIDLSFQSFQSEIDSLPGKYAKPDGALILAKRGSECCGCVALRRIDGETCEMKRLYVRPRFRKRGIGKGLAMRIIAEGEARGYARMRLDTLSSMKGALALYRSLGFHEIGPYIYNPIAGALFMEREINPRPGARRSEGVAD